MDGSFRHKTWENVHAKMEYDSVCPSIVCFCFRSDAREPECDILSIGQYDHRLLLFYCQLYQFDRLFEMLHNIITTAKTMEQNGAGQGLLIMFVSAIYKIPPTLQMSFFF